jgi:hypothetical protein
MTTNNVTIEQLAQELGKTVWSKGDLKRIYLNDAGYNTKKMSTKAFIYEKDGEFRVSVSIDCPSQPDQWIESQENEVRQSILKNIEVVVFGINNPGVDYDEYQEQQSEIKEKKQIEAEQIKLSADEKEISELTIDNVDAYMRKFGAIDSSRNELLWSIKSQSFSYYWQSRFLNVKDDYAPIIYDLMFERIFLKSERHADQSFSEPIGKIKVGETTLEFNDIVDFEFAHKQGKNGPNKKNVFRPVSIPQHVTDALNAQLEIEKANRIEHLKQQVAYHTEELTKAIEAYKRKMLPR